MVYPRVMSTDLDGLIFNAIDGPPEILQSSLQRSNDLLQENRGREAVQEALWLLETVATAFQGAETGAGTVEGKYSNEIVKNLRRTHPGTTLELDPPGAIGEKFTVSQHGHEDVTHEHRRLYMEKPWVVPSGI